MGSVLMATILPAHTMASTRVWGGFWSPVAKKHNPLFRGGGYFGSGLGARGMSASLVPTIPRQPISVRFRHSHGGTEPNSTED